MMWSWPGMPNTWGYALTTVGMMLFWILVIFGAIVVLYVVATRGPITIRFYDPAAVASWALPIGFYIDRLSAVMMVRPFLRPT